MNARHSPSRRSLMLSAAASLALPGLARAGAWGPASFGNDGALDWVIDFVKTPTEAFVRETLSLVPGQLVDSFRGESIVAAAEVVAASLGRPCPDLPKDVAAIAVRSRDSFRGLAPLAHESVTLVLRGKSELRRNWSESASLRAKWEASVNDLRKRLVPGAG
jgi:hypothetical protein